MEYIDICLVHTYVACHWHGDLNLRYQSKGNHGGEVNVCQEFQLALAGAPDSSYKSSKKNIHLC